jgi:hypothetical protein
MRQPLTIKKNDVRPLGGLGFFNSKIWGSVVVFFVSFSVVICKSPFWSLTFELT